MFLSSTFFDAGDERADDPAPAQPPAAADRAGQATAMTRQERIRAAREREAQRRASRLTDRSASRVVSATARTPDKLAHRVHHHAEPQHSPAPHHKHEHTSDEESNSEDLESDSSESEDAEREEDFEADEEVLSTAASALQVRGLEATFDPSEHGAAAVASTSSGGGAMDVRGRIAIDRRDLRHFLVNPAPLDPQRHQAMVQCKVYRNRKGVHRLFPSYRMVADAEDELFLLAAQKKSRVKLPTYVVSVADGDFSSTSSAYVGKLKSNTGGTEFTMYDRGCNPARLSGERAENLSFSARQELGVVQYERGLRDTRGPRHMHVYLPRVRSGARHVFRPAKKEDSMSFHIRHKKLDDIVVVKNEEPLWDDEIGKYCLSFFGRVTEPSVKNFILADPNDRSRIMLLFGRCGPDEFTLDYAYPLSALQAFQIALTSLESKLLCA